MEIKRLLAALTAAAMLPAMASEGIAADAVIYDHGRTETWAEALDLDGWGYELTTKAVFEADVRFKEENSGITLRSADNAKGGTSIRAVMRNDTLTLAAYGGVEGNYIYYNAVDTEKTYHIALTGTYGAANGMVDMTVDTIGDGGVVEESKTSYLILMNEMYASSGIGPEHIRVEANTVVDNVKVTVMQPDSIAFVSPPQTVAAGESAELKARFYRNGDELDYAAPIEYSAEGGGASISGDGLLEISPEAAEEEIVVRAKSGELSCELPLRIVSGDIYTITEAVFDEEGLTLEAVKAVKNYFYDGDAVFAATVYDEEGRLRDSFIKKIPSGMIPMKTDADINLGYRLPKDFEPDSWTIEIDAWGTSRASEVPETEEDIPVRSFFEENGGAVEWIEGHRAIAAMLNGRTALMQIDNNKVFVDGEEHILSQAPYISPQWSAYVAGAFVKLFRDNLQ